MFDIHLGPRLPARCDGVSCRDFLRIGALGALGISLPSLYRAEALGVVRRKARAKSVILVYLGGGLSHHDSFDLKPDSPAEVRGKYKPIATNVSGLQVGELLPRMARVMNKAALVRAGAHPVRRQRPASGQQ
jgi:hypothetical protein